MNRLVRAARLNVPAGTEPSGRATGPSVGQRGDRFRHTACCINQRVKVAAAVVANRRKPKARGIDYSKQLR